MEQKKNVQKRTASPTLDDKPESAKKWKQGMRTREMRMFRERIIFLNKSTTKFVIIGIDPITFEPSIKICDRESGDFVFMDMLKLQYLLGLYSQHNMSMIAKSFGGTMHIDNPVLDDFAFELCTESRISNVWKIKVKGHDGRLNSLYIHSTSLDKLSEVFGCIKDEMTNRETNGLQFKVPFEKLQNETDGKNETQIVNHLHQVLRTMAPDTTDYQLSFDLICHRESLVDLKKYNENFFRRVLVIKKE